MLKRIRFDDVLWATGDKKIKGKEFQKFKKHIDWCKDIDIPLTPAILCQEIEQFPESIQYIEEGTKEGLFYPDLHGWTHGPYGNLDEKKISEHLEKALDWFEVNLGVMPIRWVTPHGANTIAIQDAARKFNLIVEDTVYPVMDQKVADTLLRQTKDLTYFDDRIIMVHWWERGLRLYRIARALQYGSVEEAIAASKEELDEKSFKICWKGWG